MRYWMVSNPGTCQVESLVIFGATSKRNSTDKRIIGTFGSGTKQSVCLLLRKGLNPIICSDKNMYEFGVKSIKIKDCFHKQLTYTTNKKQTKELSVTLDYGELDWNKTHMACREFVSNAIDACYEQGLSYENVVIKSVYADDIKANPGHTAVYIPESVEVNEFFNNIDKYFLHFGESKFLNTQVINKMDRKNKFGKTNIYRRGVFVREIESQLEGLFDYNFEDLQLDECRNYTEYGAKDLMTQCIAKSSENVIRTFLTEYNKKNFQEKELDSWNMAYYAESNKENWEKALNSIDENAVIASPDQVDDVVSKGYKPIVLKGSLVHEMNSRGLPTYNKKVEQTFVEQTMEASETCRNLLNKLWDKVVKYDLSNGKSKPDILLMTTQKGTGSYIFGKYKDGIIYINKDIAEQFNTELLDTIIHELAHHVSGAKDCSISFESWIISFATKLAMEVGVN